MNRYIAFVLTLSCLFIFSYQATAQETSRDYFNLAKKYLDEAKIVSGDSKNVNYEKAIDALKRATDIESAYCIKIFFTLGLSLEQTGRCKDATEAYQEASGLGRESLSNTIGWFLYKTGFYQHAIGYYLDGIRMHLKDADTLYDLGLLCERFNRKQEEAKFLKQAILLKPERAEYHYSLGRTYEFTQDPLAIESFQKAVLLKPNFLQAHISLGYALERQGRLGEAIETYRLAIGLKPESEPESFLYSRLGDSYQKLERWPESADALAKAVKLKPEDAEVNLKLGKAYVALGHKPEALEAFSQAARLDPDNPLPVFERGKVLVALDRKAEALETFQKVTQLQPDFAEAHHLIGLLFYDLGQYREAADALKLAVRLKPADARFHEQLGLAYSDLGRHEAAVNEFNQAIRLKPDYAQAYFNLGESYSELNRADDAIKATQKAVALKPDCAEAHNHLGVLLGEGEDYREAAAAHQEAVRLKPADAEFHDNLGVAYFELGRNEEAIDELNQAIRLEPEQELAYYNLGQVYSEMGRFPEATAALNKAIALKPDDVDAYTSLGSVLLKTNQPQEALNMFEKTVTLNPTYDEAHYNLGKVYLSLGDAVSADDEYVMLKNMNSPLGDDLLAEIIVFKRKKNALQLASWREKRGISQEKLSEMLKVDEKNLQAWEAAASEIPPYLFLALETLEQKMKISNHRASR